MTIIQARWETKSEKEQRLSFHQHIDKRQKSIQWCEKNRQRLLDLHKQFAESYIINKKHELDRLYNERLDKAALLDSIMEGAIVKCACGGKLRYISKFDFAGCEYYKDTTIRHTSINRPVSLEYPTEVPSPGKNYLTDFKKSFDDIPAYVQVNVIHKYLTILGAELLEPIKEEQFSVGRNAQYESQAHERIIEGVLKEKFDSVSPQQGIRVFDGYEWHLLIPDFICHNKESKDIFVFDQKKNYWNIKPDKLSDYINATQLIAGEHKSVRGYFIISNKEDKDNHWMIENKCLTVENLSSI